jgi:putative membrane protein
MSRLIFQVIAGILGFWLAVKFVPGVEFLGGIRYLLLTGCVLGLINFFIKPILNFITLPLRALTLGLFSLIINMGIIWLVDILFVELVIAGICPLFWTTVIIWVLSFFLGLYTPKRE